MKPDDILDAMENIDDVLVKKAKEKTRSQKAVWLTVGSIAAGLALAFCVPYVFFLLNGARNADPGRDGGEMAVGQDYVEIYYVDGDEIQCQEKWMRLSAEDIFNAWREKNGLGNEVKFIGVTICGDGKTTGWEFEGENVASEVGDYLVYTLTIAKSIENYYDTLDSGLLLESLKQTMTGYSGVEYDEYHLILEE